MAAQSRTGKLEKEIEGVLRKLRKANLRWKVRRSAGTKAAVQHWQSEYHRLAIGLREAYNEKGA